MITVRARLFYAAAAAAVLIAAMAFHGIDADNGTKRYMQHTEAMPAEEKPKEGFASHLPVISVETEGKKEILWLSPGGYLFGKDNEPVSEVPYAGDEALLNFACDMSVVSSEGKWHSPKDTPQLESRATIRVRGNSSRLFDKKSYLLKLADEQGAERKEPVMGMSAASEWVLNGPFLDRTLIRNYVCYTTAGQVMDYAPNVRFCELFLNGEYQGVYLMAETVSKEEGRIELTESEKGSPVTSWIVRWDRKGKAGTPVDDFTTYSLQSGVSTLDLRYPGKNTLTPERLAYVEEELSKAERAIDSADRGDPVKGYENYLDQEAFAQYFVLNEFFGNVDAGRFSTFYYKDIRGKIKPVVWDFNNGCNNYIDYIYSAEGFSMLQSPWYGELLQDEAFVEEVIVQYRSMRKGALSEESLNTLIDDTVVYLGDAVNRNYEKYGYVFDLSETDDKGYLQPVERNYTSYEEAVAQLKTWMKERGTWMDAHIESLRQYCHESKNAARTIH